MRRLAVVTSALLLAAGQSVASEPAGAAVSPASVTQQPPPSRLSSPVAGPPKSAAAAVAQPADFAYDGAGQLRGVSQASDGAGARYSYDDTGNLTGVTRSAAGALTITSIAPSRAAAGATVTISGTGFAATTAGNTVKVNGSAATVTSASATRLQATVPSGVTSGKIDVTAGGATATSEQTFTVTAAVPAPVISGFSPQIAAPGASVTITGSGFAATAADNNVSLGRTRARVTAASSTSLTVTVPEGLGSGRVTVVTAGATATSSADFTGLTRPFSTTYVSGAATLTADGTPTTVSFTTAGKGVALRFTGTKGQRLSFGVSGSTVGVVAVYGFDPYGAAFGRADFDGAWSSATLSRMLLPPLPTSGTYELVLYPSSTTATGSLTATLSTRVTGALSLTGAGTAVTLGRTGQQAELSFDATAGQRIDVGFTNTTVTSSQLNVQVREPNGTPLLWQTATAGQLSSDAQISLPGGSMRFTAALTGRTTLIVTTTDQTTGSVTVTASPQQDIGAITTGTARAVAITRPGQEIKATFTGTAGALMSLDINDSTVPYALGVDVISPDGTQLYSGYASYGRVDLPALPAAGTYTVYLLPFSSTGTFGLRLWQRQSAGTLSATGAGTAVSLSPSAASDLTFAATAGQALTFGFTFSTLPSGAVVRARVIAPDGTVTVDDDYGSLGVLAVKPATAGTYHLVLAVEGGQSGSVTVTLSTQVAGGALTFGTAKTFSAVRAGQNTLYTFAGTAGQRPVLMVDSYTLPHTLGVYAYKPDGTQLSFGYLNNNLLNLGTLATTGTYQLVIQPFAETGTMGFAVVDGTDAGATTVNGTAKVLTTTTGKYADTAITVTAGQRLSFGFTSNTFTNQSAQVQLANSAGVWVGGGAIGAGSSLDTVALTAGTYRLMVVPLNRGTGSVTVTVSTQVNGGTLTLNTAKTFTFSRIGQSVYTAYTGTSGQLLSVSYTAVTGYYPGLTIRNSAGTVVAVLTGAATITIPALPAAGTYEFLFTPYSYTSAGAATATLKTRTAAAAARRAPDGAPATLSAPGRATPPGTEPAPPAAPKAKRKAPAAAIAATDLIAGRGPAPGETWQPGSADLAGGGWSTGRPVAAGRAPEPLRASPGTTALSGRVLTLEDKPLAGVTVSVDNVRATTDSRGQFLLAGLRGGHRVLRVDGSTASTAQRAFGLHDIGVDLAAGQTTVLPYTIWLSKLDTAHEVSFASPATAEVTISTPAIPGLRVELPAGAVVRDVHGKVVTKLGITAIPVDRTPFPLPRSQVPSYFTVQPGSSYVFPAGARVIYPNFTHAKAGASMDFWHYDPAGKGWYIYGKGTVTPDGRSVEPDKGTEVYEFTGAMLITPGADPPPATAPAPGNGATGADPVDLATGLLVDNHTDLVVNDVIPLDLTRTYQQSDTGRRAFGIGANFTYGLDLYSTNRFVDCWLILPDGGRIRFQRISPGGHGGYDYLNGVFAADPNPTQFNGSILAWNGNGWDLRLRDGTTYLFGDEAPLQAIRDKFGNTVTLTRAPAAADSDGITRNKGPITQITSPNGKWIKLSYDSANRVTRAEDVLGRSVVYTYNSDGRLETVKDPENGVARYSYENGLLKSITDPKQTVYLTNEYDTNGRVKKQTQPDTGTWSFAYTLDAAGKVTATQLTDPRNHVRRVEFDAGGFPVTDTLAFSTALAQKTTITYDAATHLPTSYVDGLNRRTDLGYDAYGNVHTVTELAGTAAARTTTIDHDGPYQQISKVTDPLSHATSFGYGANNALRTATDALSRVTTLETGEDGQVISAATGSSPATTYGYALGDLATTTDPVGAVTRTFTDAAGRTTRGIDAQGNVTTLSYTGTSQVRTVTDPLGRVTTFEYDANGNVHRSIDARQHATVYEYDTSDRLHTVTDPLDRVATYTYDANGNVAGLLSAAGKRTTFTYDELDRLDLVRYGVSADGGTQESQVRYGYDLGDRIRTVTDSAAGITTVTPDDFDRITTSAGPQGTVGYTYDAADRRRTMTVAGQADTTYTYNNADQLTAVARGTQTVAVDYDTTGRRKTLTLPAGVTQSYSYDDASQLKSIGYSRGTTSLGAINYTLDPLGRLIHAEGSYARVQLPAAYGPASYDAADQLTTAGGATFGYDDDGNLASDGTATYAWNGRGQLTSYAKPGLSVTYGYDGLGRRSSRTAGGATTAYLYDGLNAVQESDGTAVTASMLTGGLDEVFSRTTPAGSQSLLSDALGSTVALSSTSAIGAEYTYDPFGTTSVTGDDGGNPTRFAGREDDGNGLYYDRARYLSPGTGRFISQDPAGLSSGDTNPYTYAANEPTGLIDPLGLKPQGSRQSCASNSFAPGTPVLMADGTTKPIEQVRAGDRVMAGSGGDPATPREVTATITGDGDKDLVQVTVAGGETLTATAGHPFWTDDDGAAATPGGRWIDAAELRQGDWLRTSDGRLVRVAGTHALRQPAVVHNLTIDDLHTYYVVAGDDAVLVHNTGGSECGARSLLDRAKELKTRNATTAVVRVRATKPSADGSYAEETWIATSYKSQPGKWKQAGFLKSGEVYKGPANPKGPATHAEEDIVAALGNDWEIVEGAANVNVCAGRCMPALHQLGIKVGGETFLTYKVDIYTPWRLFWSQ